MKGNEQLPPATEWAYLEGEVTKSEAAAVEAQLADSGASRRSMDRARAILDALRAPSQELEGADLVPDLRRAIEQGAALPGRQRSRWTLVLGGGLVSLAMAATVLVAFRGPIARMLRPPSTEDSELRPKGVVGDDADRWTGIQVFQVRGDAAAVPLGSSLRADDGLLFAYTNLGPAPFAYVMIFGVDGAGQVYWFHPAHQQAGEDPASIPIAAGASAVELRELIHHRFSSGPLAVYGLFTSAPLRVSSIERAVRGLTRNGAFEVAATPRLAPPGAGQQVVLTRVDQ